MTRIEEIKKLELFPIIGQESHLNVKGLKEDEGKDKTGFFITGMRFINIEQSGPRRIRSRIAWNDKPSLQVEENVSSVMRRGIALSVFDLKLKKVKDQYEFEEAVPIRGNPDIKDNTFEGVSIKCEWSNNPPMIEISSTEGRFLSCRLRTKQQIIEVKIG